ncbi:MAG: DNA-binding transcriptional activator PspC [Candidatus Methanolliviera sp. GoM_oil]|nr:MAG: DNA-binding transcriptional activator PspC [Candidatus Methanolliviera sp. GoM_oil]
MQKRLYRSRTDKKLGGVCSGIGEYFDLDPTLIRVLWVIITVFTDFAPGIIAYILLWLIVPEEPAKIESSEAEVEGKGIDVDVKIDDRKGVDDRKDNKTRSILVIIGILLFAFVFFKYFSWFNWWNLSWHRHMPMGFVFSVFPVILLILGVLLIVLGMRSK